MYFNIMKYIDKREKENLQKYKKEIIYKHLFECLKRIEKKENIDTIIKQHKQLINNLEIKGTNKNKFKTLSQLVVYKNSKDKVHALACFLNYLNNLKLLH